MRERKRKANGPLWKAKNRQDKTSDGIREGKEEKWNLLHCRRIFCSYSDKWAEGENRRIF